MVSTTREKKTYFRREEAAGHLYLFVVIFVKRSLAEIVCRRPGVAEAGDSMSL